MGRNMERFNGILREKGIFAAIAKTIGYLRFILRRGRLEKVWSGASVVSGSLRIKCWNTGPQIYWDELELTKSAAINTSVFVNGKWHDSSKASWSLAEAGPGRLIIKNRWGSLPLSQTWTISERGDGKVACKIELEAERDMEFIEQKFTVMLSEQFNLWMDSANRPVKFPQFKEWSEIKEVKRDSAFIGAQSDIDSSLPGVVVKKINGRQKRLYPQIQNSDHRTRARLLNFVGSSRDCDLRYGKGVSAFFEMEIEAR